MKRAKTSMYIPRVFFPAVMLWFGEKNHNLTIRTYVDNIYAISYKINSNEKKIMKLVHELVLKQS